MARDSDKDDPIDAEKLAQWYRGGYVKAVHVRMTRMALRRYIYAVGGNAEAARLSGCR